MPEYSIRDKCHITKHWDGDTFVGIKCEDGQFEVDFPLGYHLSKDEKGLRKDILQLLRVIALTVDKRESQLLNPTDENRKIGFPFQAYLYIIADFYNRGYYKEREVQFKTETRGKIDWNRTIKRQKPYMQDNNVFYLQFTTRKNPLNENELITLIHECCVYESFSKLGWLFTSALPSKPKIKFNQKMFRNVVREKISHTFNDKNKSLFLNMLAVIDQMQNLDAPLNFEYGVDPFDHVWEVLIDEVFGIKGKKEYYPKTTWAISDTDYDNADLKPDSILVWNGNVYVLDAKNYKYGYTRLASDLPKSTDINKQITYGEYIAENELFKKKHGESFETYNAFLMPYDGFDWNENGEKIRWIGEATGNWKSNKKKYERVQGILVDVKSLMAAYKHSDEKIIEELVEAIENGLAK